jgi:hypothetical protein
MGGQGPEEGPARLVLEQIPAAADRRLGEMPCGRGTGKPPRPTIATKASVWSSCAKPSA